MTKVPLFTKTYVKQLKNLNSNDLFHIANPYNLDKIKKSISTGMANSLIFGKLGMKYHVTHGVFPKKYCKFRCKAPMCTSCSFITALQRQWQNKFKMHSFIFTFTNNTPGVNTSFDQLVSIHLGLVQQMSG